MVRGYGRGRWKGKSIQILRTGSSMSTKANPPSAITPMVEVGSRNAEIQEANSNGTVPILENPGSDTSPIVTTQLELTGVGVCSNTNPPLTNPTPRRDLLAQNRSASNGFSLSYIPMTMVEGKPVVTLDNGEIEVIPWRGGML